jgi:hypothetical protein
VKPQNELIRQQKGKKVKAIKKVKKGICFHRSEGKSGKLKAKSHRRPFQIIIA